MTAAVSEGSDEVGTVYVSDLHGLGDKLEILEKVPYDLTGDVIYPAAQVKNTEADDAEKTAARISDGIRTVRVLHRPPAAAGREAVIPAALAAQALLSGIILMGNK